MVRNVGIAFVTGRKHFQNVLRSYVNNWLEHGLIADKNIRLHLFVVYDVSYTNTKSSDFRNIPPELSGLVQSINFYGRDELKSECDDLISRGIITEAEGDLLFGEGYAKKRNAALYFAAKKKMERLLFIDDDEYPLAVAQNNPGNLIWMGQSVLGTHLKHGNDADITHGHHCGYISPIPRIEFDNNLTENDFRQFIEATSNDIVTWESVKNVVIENSGVTYADERFFNGRETFEVDEIAGMKFISGANLCFNLERLKSLPVFYNPPGARGEDAFMSTILTDYKVVRVPCYTFHDAFLAYKNILNGILPTKLIGVNARDPIVLRRFIKASIGWIRYKPLLTYITQREKYETIIDDVKEKLDLSIPKLCGYFGTMDFEQIRHDLAKYDKNVRRHFLSFESTRVAWKKITAAILPIRSIGAPRTFKTN